MPRQKQIPQYISQRLNLDSITSSRPLLCLIDEQGPISQTQAAGQLQMSAGACNLHFQRLEHEGLIRRVDDIRKGRGRPTIAWDLDHEHNLCITLVFDVPHLRATLTDFSGKIIREQDYDLSNLAEQQKVVEVCCKFIRACLAQAQPGNQHIRQVFAAFPGLLDAETGIPRSVVNFPLLEGIELASIIDRKFALPCVCGPHGLAFLYGETEDLPADKTAMVLYWDLGINVIFGRNQQVLALQSGPDSRPLISEIGHICVRKNGPRCHCGKHGCLESYTGGWALIEELADPTVTSLKQFVDRTAADDPKAIAVTSHAAHRLGLNLAWPIQLMNVDRIIVTGPMAPAFKQVQQAFCDGLNRTFNEKQIENLAPTASPDPRKRMLRGAYLIARQLFMHPETYAGMPGTPQQLR
jgi:predicted NBD/HSP70 family sugar kinase